MYFYVIMVQKYDFYFIYIYLFFDDSSILGGIVREFGSIGRIDVYFVQFVGVGGSVIVEFKYLV